MPLVFPKAAEDETSGAVNQNASTITSQGQKYNVTYLQYPYNLDTSPEYGVDQNGKPAANKVIFFINVPAGSSVIKNNSINTDGTGSSTGYIDVPVNEYSRASGERLKGIARDATGSVGFKPTILESKKRLLTAISLYTPATLRNRYSVSWSEEDMLGTQLLGETAKAAGDAFSAFKNSNGFAGGVAAAATGLKNVVTPRAAFGARSILDKLPYAQKILGIAPSNSKQEQLFRGVDFRTFEFDYKFAPRNEIEAGNVLSIIRAFRHHMLPEFLDKSEFLYIYPSEFDVRYYKGDSENQYLEKQMTAVLTTVNVDYAPLGIFNTFANGMPTHINLNLSFKELALPSKESSPATMTGV